MMSDPWEKYFYPGTDVLKNKFGIRDTEGLREAEYFATATRETELDKKPIKGNFDMEHLQAYHKHLFQDVYEWAGKLRTVNMSKGETLFAHVNYLESGMKDIQKRLEKDNFLHGLEKKEFVNKFTDVYGDINALHPFREGNGRSTRCFMKKLANEAGYELDFSKINQNRNRWNEASELSNFGKMGELRSILNEAIYPQRSHEQIAPRHDLNKNQPQMHANATERMAENLKALKQNPALAGKPPETLERLAYQRGIAQECYKHYPQPFQDEKLAHFDKEAENPAFLEKLEKSVPAREPERAEEAQSQRRNDDFEQSR